MGEEDAYKARICSRIGVHRIRSWNFVLCVMALSGISFGLYHTPYQLDKMEARRARSTVVHGYRERGEREPYCADLTSIYPGSIYIQPNDTDRYRWEPWRECRIKHFTTAELATCAATKRIALFGDSLLDDVGEAIHFKSGTNQTIYTPKEHVKGREVKWGTRSNRGYQLPGAAEPFLQSFWTPSVFHSDPTEGARRNASHALRTSDYVMIHHGVWDSGQACQGLHAFYHALKARITKMQALVKPGAVLILYDLHWLWPKQCLLHKGMNSKCYRWNPIGRVKNYRRAIRLAAACTGVRLFSDAGMTQNTPTHTTDGIHYNTHYVMFLKADLFLNGVCERDGAPPMQFNTLPPESCDELAALKDWEDDKLARDCPQWG